MQNANLICCILAFVQNDDIFPTWILVNKKFNKLLNDKWKRLQETDKPKYDIMRYFHNVKKHNPPINVKLDYYGSTIFNQEGYSSYGPQECLWFQIKVSPVYPGHKVGVRYTQDEWKSYTDKEGLWYMNGMEEEIWKIDLWLKDEQMLSQISFAIFSIDIKGNLYWDNNDDDNYYIPFPRDAFKLVVN